MIRFNASGVTVATLGQDLRRFRRRGELARIRPEQKKGRP
jgi:hypothetical protein